MKALIIGKNGQVGYELHRIVEGAAVDIPEIDFTDPASIREVVRAAAPDVIFNAAAYTAVDKAESECDLACAINSEAPRILAEETARLGSLLVHYSTEYVYDGSAAKPYREGDSENPLSLYGKSKLEGDRVVAALAPKHLILRTSWVYGARGRNFLLTMLKLGSEREELRIVDDQRGAPTWCRDLARGSIALAKESIERAISGLYHIAGSGETTWCGFARAIFEEAGLDPKVVPISTEEYPTPAKRPKNSLLDQSKMERDFGFVMPHWRDSLRSCMQENPTHSLARR